MTGCGVDLSVMDREPQRGGKPGALEALGLPRAGFRNRDASGAREFMGAPPGRWLSAALVRSRGFRSMLLGGWALWGTMGALDHGALASGEPIAVVDRRLSDPPSLIRSAFSPPPAYANALGTYRPVLRFDDGQPVLTPEDWRRRRTELVAAWHAVMGAWPPLIDAPKLEVLTTATQEGFGKQRVRVELAPGRMFEGWLLVPAGEGPFPAVLVPFYEPETSIGLGKPLRDFALHLTRRGFVTLSIGSPGGDAWKPERNGALCQPLSYLAYLAANAANALGNMPRVDARRLGVVGHSYGGKWALFAGAFCERFAAVAVSDPGIVWDESRPNVNYWEPWYLGLDPATTRKPGVITESNGRTGAYKALVAAGRDLHELHALIAPRPFFVSGGSEDPEERWVALNHSRAVNQLLGFTNRVGMTNRSTHDPTPASNEQLYAFFEWALGSR